MKFILILLLIFPKIYADSLSIVPSLFYTYSKTSYDSKATSIAGYFSFQTNTNNWIVGNYDNLIINHNEWDYKQNFISAGNIYYTEPIFLNIYFGYINGSFNSKIYDYNYSDKTYFVQAETKYQNYPYYFGISYNFLNLDGFYNKKVNNITGKIDWIPHWRLSISPYFSHTDSDDGRKLFGAGLKANYLLLYDLLLKLNLFKGERAYFYDSETLTIFNQDETQKQLLSIKGEYFFTYGFSFNAAYLYTDFNGYNINYFSFGLKGFFNY